MSKARDKEDTSGQQLHGDVESSRYRDVWTVLVGLRLINALTLATFFVPDEFYQALEPAWALAFGEGSAPKHSYINGPWMAWEWTHSLRSSVFPAFLAGIYKTIDFVSDAIGIVPITKSKLLIMLPKTFLAGIAALMDYYTWSLGEKVFGHRSTESFVALCMMVASPWQWVVSTRALTNCVETTLTVMALYYWPWQWLKTPTGTASRRADDHKIKYCVMLAALACVIRASNVIIWATLTVLIIGYATASELGLLVRNGIIYGSVVLVASSVCDILCYGKVVFPALNWLLFNVNEDAGAFYGENRIDYYFTEGIPLLLTTALPFAMVGLVQALTGSSSGSTGSGSKASVPVLRNLAIVSLVLPLVLSYVSHKEARFIYPILPILVLISARPIANFFHPFPTPNASGRALFLYTLVALNVSAALYFGLTHNRGVMDVMDYLRSKYELENKELVTTGKDYTVEPIFAGFLMPCHSTPWRSHMVYDDIRSWTLSCEPPFGDDGKMLEGKAREEYEDESDTFYKDPAGWIKYEFATQRKTWPQHLVFFEALQPELLDIIKTPEIYHECFRGFNSRYLPDYRREGDVIVWCKEKGSGRPIGGTKAGEGMKGIMGMMGHGFGDEGPPPEG